MSIYSPQVWHCNACGAKQVSELPRAMGTRWRCCSMACCDEMHWRETLSIMGKPYTARKEQGSHPGKKA